MKKQTDLPNANDVRNALRALANPNQARILSSFFKCGPGQYGEGDVFLGIKVPQMRAVARSNKMLPLSGIKTLLASPYHEERQCALFILTFMYHRENEEVRKKIVDFYLDHTAQINNWDLVDLSAPEILGDYLLSQPHTILDTLLETNALWPTRIAVVSTLTLIRHNQCAPTYRLAQRLLNHPHDLIQKVVGWMLRECGKRDRAQLDEFLTRYGAEMARTTLRYAIERHSIAERKHYLESTKKNGAEIPQPHR